VSVVRTQHWRHAVVDSLVDFDMPRRVYFASVEVTVEVQIRLARNSVRDVLNKVC